MKSYVPLGIIVLLAAAAFVVVWNNRASEKIITAVLPIAVAALVGVSLSVFVFGEQPAFEEVFPAAFMLDVDTRMPVSLPLILQSRRFYRALFAPSELAKVSPEALKDDSQGQLVYHHLLQKSLVDFIGTLYRASWQTEILSFDLPAGRTQLWGPAEGAIPPARVLTTPEVEALLKGNLFARIHSGIPPQIALPSGMTLRITPPHQTPDRGTTGEIAFKGPFCTVSIRTEDFMWGRSIGSYALLLGVPNVATAEAKSPYATATYIVRLKAEFTRWRSGHPDTAKYRKWVRQLADELRIQFDEQVIWQKTMEDYRFWKETGGSPGGGPSVP